MSAFDAKLRGAALSRLGLPSSIPDSAIFSFHQPIGTGGLGFAEAELTCPAARWACLALAADEVQELVESGTECALVLDRIDTFNTLRRAGVPLTDAAHDGCGPAADEWKLLPSSPALLHTHYLGLDGQSLPHLQKALSAVLSRERRRSFMLSFGSGLASSPSRQGLTITDGAGFGRDGEVFGPAENARKPQMSEKKPQQSDTPTSQAQVLPPAKLKLGAAVGEKANFS